MSKKKTKIEKVATRHQFSHLEKIATIKMPDNQASAPVTEKIVNTGPKNGFGKLILKDLRFSAILISCALVLIILLAVIFHFTPLADDLLLKFGITY